MPKETTHIHENSSALELEPNHYDVHGKPYLNLNEIGAREKDIVLGDASRVGRTIVINGDIKKGTRLRIFGWDLHVRGSIEDDVRIEYVDHDINRHKANIVCVDKDIHNNVKINNATSINVNGIINNHCELQANFSITIKDCGEHNKFTSLGAILAENIGKNSELKSYNMISGNVFAQHCKLQTNDIVYAHAIDPTCHVSANHVEVKVFTSPKPKPSFLNFFNKKDTENKPPQKEKFTINQ